MKILKDKFIGKKPSNFLYEMLSVSKLIKMSTNVKEIICSTFYHGELNMMNYSQTNSNYFVVIVFWSEFLPKTFAMPVLQAGLKNTDFYF